MTDSEKRRTQLLKATRILYTDHEIVPAVHPRYQAVYQNLYALNEGETDAKNSTLGIRVIIAILLFILFVVMDYQDITYANVNSQNIVQQIEKELLTY